MSSWDARVAVARYYDVVAESEPLHSPEELHRYDVQRACSPGGVCVVLPSLVLYAWECDAGVIWVNTAIGYLVDVVSLVHHLSGCRVRYMHRGRVRECALDYMLRRLDCV